MAVDDPDAFNLLGADGLAVGPADVGDGPPGTAEDARRLVDADLDAGVAAESEGVLEFSETLLQRRDGVGMGSELLERTEAVEEAVPQLNDRERRHEGLARRAGAAVLRGIGG